MTEYEHVGNGVTIHLPSGTIVVERGEVVEMDAADAEAIAGNPDWVAVKPPPKSSKTDKKEDDQ